MSLKSVEDVAKKYGIHVEAYHFVVDALQFTVEELADSSGKTPRHLHAHELLDGLVRFGAKKFGMLSDTVFRQWGIKSNDDIANIVYQMIELEMLKKSDNDTFGDFENAPELYEALHNCSVDTFGE
jgi:uncharacterized repeat protein (TIGR04138 family)